jgi:hypothetical protein
MRRKSLLAIAVILLLAVGVAVMSAGSTAAPSSFRLRGWAKPSASNAAAATAAAEAAAKDARRLVLILREVDFREFDLPPVGQVNPGRHLPVHRRRVHPGRAAGRLRPGPAHGDVPRGGVR